MNYTELYNNNQLILTFKFHNIEDFNLDKYTCFIPKNILLQYYKYQFFIEASCNDNSESESMYYFSINQILAIFFPEIQLKYNFNFCTQQDDEYTVFWTLQKAEEEFFNSCIEYCHTGSTGMYFLRPFILKQYGFIVLNSLEYNPCKKYLILSKESSMNEELAKLSAKYALLYLSKKWKK